MKTIWDSRFSVDFYQYGKNPNEFFKKIIDSLPKGKILIVAAGEGRDAIYAAKIGWEVIAFDLSEEGKKKALKLAEEENLSINYQLADAMDIEFEKNSFDAIACVFFHLAPDLRKKFHHKAMEWLKAGGTFILEGFNKNQLGKNSGGPKDIHWLFSQEELEEDFKKYPNKLITNEVRNLDEGPLHQGIAELIHLTIKK